MANVRNLISLATRTDALPVETRGEFVVIFFFGFVAQMLITAIKNGSKTLTSIVKAQRLAQLLTDLHLARSTPLPMDPSRKAGIV